MDNLLTNIWRRLRTDPYSVKSYDEKDPNEVENKALAAARGATGTGLAEYLTDKLPRDRANSYAGMSAGESVGGLGDILARSLLPADTAQAVQNESRKAAGIYPKAGPSGAQFITAPLQAAAAPVIEALSLPGQALSQAGVNALQSAYSAPEGSDRLKAGAKGAALGASIPLAQAAGKAAFGRRLSQLDRPPSQELSDSDLQPLDRPTIPPAAISQEAKDLAKREASDRVIRPPAAPEADAQSAALERLPENRLPAEFRGEYRPGTVPDDQLFPPDSPADAYRHIRALAQRRKDTINQELNMGRPASPYEPPETLQTDASNGATPTMPAGYVKPARLQMTPEYNATPNAGATMRPEDKTLPHRFADPGDKVALPEYTSVAPSNESPTFRPSTFRPPSVTPLRESDLYHPGEEMLQSEAQSLPSPAPVVSTVSRTVVPGTANRLALMPPPEALAEEEAMLANADLRAPRVATAPRNPASRVDVEDFKREYNKEHDIGTKTAKPKRRKKGDAE